MEEQEVQLIDYLKVIWKRKGIIIGGTLLAAATALVVSLSMPKTYEVSRTLKIGKLPSNTESQIVVQIESREDVIGRLRDHRVLKDIINDLQLELTPEQTADSISVDTRTNPNIRYVVRAPAPHVAAQIADRLAESIISFHGQMFDTQIQVAKEYEAELEGTIHSIEEEIVAMKSTLEKLIKSADIDTPIVILLLSVIKDRQRMLANLRRELKKARLSRLVPDNTAVIAADDLPEYPVKPKVGFNVAIAGVLGLMMFTVLAFFMEYLEKARERPGKYETD